MGIHHTIPEKKPQQAWRIRDFAEANGVGLTTLYAEIKAGRLKARKLGKVTLITDEDGRAWRDSLPPLKSTAVAA